jgi:hypothetical protein
MSRNWTHHQAQVEAAFKQFPQMLKGLKREEGEKVAPNTQNCANPACDTRSATMKVCAKCKDVLLLPRVSSPSLAGSQDSMQESAQGQGGSRSSSQ